MDNALVVIPKMIFRGSNQHQPIVVKLDEKNSKNSKVLLDGDL
jgi:hypothetical protein